MNSKKVIKMYPKWQFEKYAKDQGWKFDSTGFHEAHINSNKLPDSMKYQPSYIVDRIFDDAGYPLIWVEVKSCSREGLIRVLKNEWAVHKQFNNVWNVFYAIYRPTSKDFPVFASISSLEHFLSDEGDYLTANVDDLIVE
jgi:hypothetical protein